MAAQPSTASTPERLLSRRLPQEFAPKSGARPAARHALAAATGAAPLLQARSARALRGAEAVYTNFVHNDLDALRQAKAWGLKVVHEQFLDPARRPAAAR